MCGDNGGGGGVCGGYVGWGGMVLVVGSGCGSSCGGTGGAVCVWGGEGMVMVCGGQCWQLW